VFSDALWWRHNKSNMADGRHIENRLLAIFPRFIARLTRNFVWSRITFRHRSRHTWPKYQILTIQDGGRPPFWKWFYRYISAGNHPISMKFGVPLQILVLRKVMWESIKILQIQNGGRPPYWKWTFGYIAYISAIVRLTQNFVSRSRITFRHRSRDQNTRFWKFKMADGRHFENAFIAISQPGIIRFQ